MDTQDASIDIRGVRFRHGYDRYVLDGISINVQRGTGVLRNLFHRIHRTLGSTSVIVSHDVAETLAIADYAYLLVDGGSFCSAGDCRTDVSRHTGQRPQPRQPQQADLYFES